VDVPTDHLVLDATMEFALAHAYTGLHKMSYALRAAGHDGQVAFIPMPDLSVTGNTDRWRAGFSYGGLVLWEASARMQFPDIRPNACGVTLVATTEDVDPRGFVHEARRLEAALGAGWDYGRGNHFLAVYRSPTETYLLVHGGSSRAKGQSHSFVGMYPERSSWIRKHATLLETPSGQLYVLRDDSADEYYAQYNRMEKEVRTRRREICRTLLPRSRVVFEGTHQGLVAPNAVSLGAYVGSGRTGPAPVMVGPGEPLVMVTGGWPLVRLPPEMVSSPDSRRRLFRQCSGWTLVPHGSGDYFPEVRRIERVNGSACDRYRVELGSGAEVLLSDISRLRERWRSSADASRAIRALGLERQADLIHVLTIM
jgi:hypothetical protein